MHPIGAIGAIGQSGQTQNTIDIDIDTKIDRIRTSESDYMKQSAQSGRATRASKPVVINNNTRKATMWMLSGGRNETRVGFLTSTSG